MKSLLFITVVLVAAVASMVWFAKRAARKFRANPKAIKSTRLTGYGGGRLYNEHWPGKKK